MNNLSSAPTSLLDRPLCRRYAAAVFTSTPAPNWGGAAASPSLIRWALGTLIDGRAQILGVWRTTNSGHLALPNILGDIHRRGAEFVRFGVGDLSGGESAFHQTYRHGQLVGSIEKAFESAIAGVPARDRPAVSRDLRASADAIELSDAQMALARFQGTTLGKIYPSVVQLWAEALSGCQPLYALHPELRELVRAADCKAAEVRGQLTQAILRHGPFISQAAWYEFVVAVLERADRQLGRDHAAAQALRDADPTSAKMVIPPQGGGARGMGVRDLP